MTEKEIVAMYMNETINALQASGIAPFTNSANDPVLKVIIMAQGHALAKIIISERHKRGNNHNNSSTQLPTIDLTET